MRVHFKAVGAAPILKKNKFLIPASEPFGTVCTIGGLHPACCSRPMSVLHEQVIKFLRAQLKVPDGSSLVRFESLMALAFSNVDPIYGCHYFILPWFISQYLYCNSAFSPNPEDPVLDVYEVRYMSLAMILPLLCRCP